MCRLVEYVGPPVPLSAVLLEPPHSLLHQSYRPREMLSGTVNADGFGIAWYPKAGEAPCLYTSTLPIWADENLARLAPRFRAEALSAAVRSATPGMPFGPEACQPFVHGRLAFNHNGFVADFARSTMRRLRESLSDDLYAELRGSTDSEHLFVLFLQCLREGGDEPSDMARALARTFELVSSCSRDGAVEIQFTCAATDGRVLLGARLSNRETAPTLYVCTSHPRFPGGSFLASEPLDQDGDWRAVPPGHLVVVEEGVARTHPAFA
ncbi:MAG: class II glutamine amidotransferase [Candidatus Binatia bacterium]|nr:MAG: class II glutamine amidotransferase [Candidatus Binatia bacterium]